MAVRNRGLAQLALFVVLAVLHTWPLASAPGHLSRLDNNDTAFNTWIIAWVAHQVPRDPLHLFQAPIFYPERDTLAYSEHMLVPSMMGAPLLWAGASPVLVYNLLVMAGLALSGWSMSLVVGRWTGSLAAGIVAGALYAFNAHALTRFPHLQAQHMELFPMALLALDRVLSRRRARDAALLAVAFVLQALCSNYTMVFVAFALAAAVVVRPDGWWTRARQVWPSLIGAGALSLALLIPFLLPYQRVRAEQGLVRSLDEIAYYSAGWRDYLTTAGRLHYEWWSAAFHGQNALFPGAIALLLVAVTLITGGAWRDRRGRMALAFGALGVALSFGVHLPGYAWLHAYLLPLQGIRVAGRWGILGLAAVAILAGFGVAAIEETWKRRAWRGWPATAAMLLALVTIEAIRAPMGFVPFEGIPRIYDRLAQAPGGAMIVFPLYPGGNFHLNAPYLLGETRSFRPIVNGYSSFAPASFHARANRFQAFPSPAVLDELAAIGVTDVLLYRTRLTGVAPEAFESLKTMPRIEYVLEEDGIIWCRLRG